MPSFRTSNTRKPLGNASIKRVRFHHTKKTSKAKGVPLRLALLTISSFVLLPILYLQYHLIQLNDSRHHSTLDQLKHFQQTGRVRKKSSPGASSPSRVLAAYLESPSTLTYYTGNSREPWFSRNTTAARLTKVEFPQVNGGGCDPARGALPDLPIDDFPTQDPFLPWIHDYFVSEDSRTIQFVSQNKRRCDTGEHHMDTMAFWEPQVALFQPIPIVEVNSTNGRNTFRLASSLEEATHPATRFQCRFLEPETNESMTTLSIFKFDYEYITWRKLRHPMIDRKGGKDTAMFWLSTLLFSCPIPDKWQSLFTTESLDSTSSTSLPNLYLDLIPIRTPVRDDQLLLTANHTGPEEYTKLQSQQLFPLDQVFGKNQFLPPPEDSGRWANLPLCRRPRQEQVRQPPATPAGSTTSVDKVDDGPPRTERAITSKQDPSFQFVACTWTAASYTRRGDVMRVSDSAARLREWIVFHLMVGVEHVYIYDNTELSTNSSSTSSTTTKSVLWEVTQEFPEEQVTYHSWPCEICNNNRPAHHNPGERSSQYAAEASCRERYGPLTQWMTFLDVDEYLVPMRAVDTNVLDEEKEYDWRPILNEMKAKGVPILQFLSSRARPREDLMEELEDQSICKDPTGQKNDKYPNTDRCTGLKKGETFLNVYNCEYIRPPKPHRFARARKQIYQTSHVWSHFVHYSTVTADYAETYSQFSQKYPDGSGGKFLSSASGPTWTKRYPDVFADELTTGALIHARSVMPHETRRLSAECTLGSKISCMVGYACEDSVAFIDEKHQDNVFHNSDGSYCNCWENPVVSQSLVPQLADRLKTHKIRQKLVAA